MNLDRMRMRAALLWPMALSLAVFHGILGTQASAQETDREYYTAYFERLDQDKDGSFSLADFRRISAKEFKRIDDNKDGAVTIDEFLYGVPASRQDEIERFTRRFKASDADGDGKLTAAENLAFCEKVVTAADTNRDGKVTLDEFLGINGGDQ